jgi:hypothetical protein
LCVAVPEDAVGDVVAVAPNVELFDCHVPEEVSETARYAASLFGTTLRQLATPDLACYTSPLGRTPPDAPHRRVLRMPFGDAGCLPRDVAAGRQAAQGPTRSGGAQAGSASDGTDRTKAQRPPRQRSKRKRVFTAEATDPRTPAPPTAQGPDCLGRKDEAAAREQA